MPVKIRKVKGGYRVRTPGGVKAKRTTKRKAKGQARFLNAVEHGWNPGSNVVKKKRGKKK